MKEQRQTGLVAVNLIYITALAVVVFPLLLISQYNYPSADDWSFGVYGYRALQSGGGIFSVLGAAFRAVGDNYLNWEGRFSSTLFAALQPGIWGEQYYVIVAWLMIGCLVLSEMMFFGGMLGLASGRNARWLTVPIIVPALIMQILYSPGPEESFYWYTGAVNYTFVYGLSLVLLTLFTKLGLLELPRWKYGLTAVFSAVLAVLIGGNNYATSLSVFLTLLILSLLFFMFNRKAFYRTWYITVLMGVSLSLCITAPGNIKRINGNFGGETGNALEAVFMSLVRSFTNIYSWTNAKVVLSLLLILPFVWKAVRNARYRFRFPALFSLVTFGLYASQITATMYVDGTTGGRRMAAILFYSYYVWLVENFCYWLGWLGWKQCRARDIFDKAAGRWERYILLYCMTVGIFLAGMIYTMDLRDITSYKAYRNWRQGWAQQYAAEWQERLKVLHDDSVKNVEFEPLTVSPEMLMYTDLQLEDGYLWVNDACREYYGKESLGVKVKEE